MMLLIDVFNKIYQPKFSLLHEKMHSSITILTKQIFKIHFTKCEPCLFQAKVHAYARSESQWYMHLSENLVAPQDGCILGNSRIFLEKREK